MMYDIVMNVVMPARISVRIVVLDSDRWKVLSRNSRIITNWNSATFPSLHHRKEGWPSD